MAGQDVNAALQATSFLYGGNAAYIEDLYERFRKDPASVDAELSDFFAALKDDQAAPARPASAADWARPDWPVPMNGELVAAFDGNWEPIAVAVESALDDSRPDQ